MVQKYHQLALRLTCNGQQNTKWNGDRAWGKRSYAPHPLLRSRGSEAGSVLQAQSLTKEGVDCFFFCQSPLKYLEQSKVNQWDCILHFPPISYSIVILISEWFWKLSNKVVYLCNAIFHFFKPFEYSPSRELQLHQYKMKHTVKSDTSKPER